MTTRFDRSAAAGAAHAGAEVRYALTALGEAILREPAARVPEPGPRRRPKRATLTPKVAP